MTKLQWIKLSVLLLVPLLGALYAYQFTGQARETVVPFKPFMAPKIEALGFEPGQIAALGSQNPSSALRSLGVPSISQAIPLRRNVTVVNFWATWCPPCVEEFPAMIELQRELEDEGVEILFVSVDEDWTKVQDFFNQYGLNVLPERLLWDPKKEMATQWGSVRFPETYVIRKDQWVVERIVGLQQWTRPAVIEYFRGLSQKFAEI